MEFENGTQDDKTWFFAILFARVVQVMLFSRFDQCLRMSFDRTQNPKGLVK